MLPVLSTVFSPFGFFCITSYYIVSDYSHRFHDYCQKIDKKTVFLAESFAQPPFCSILVIARSKATCLRADTHRQAWQSCGLSICFEIASLAQRTRGLAMTMLGVFQRSLFNGWETRIRTWVDGVRDLFLSILKLSFNVTFYNKLLDISITCLYLVFYKFHLP